jgi:hypothetical protein
MINENFKTINHLKQNAATCLKNSIIVQKPT